ncbi:hypothetical protein BH11PLA2_BH11PLA2_03490 [soil metagenome]
MIETFSRNGVTFKYPINWVLEEELDDDGDWVVTLQTPGTALLILSYRIDAEPVELADESLEALLADYPDLDSEPTAEKIAGKIALGHDIDFLAVDLPVNAQVRALDLDDATLLLFWQMADVDRDHYEPLIKAILASLTLSPDNN